MEKLSKVVASVRKFDLGISSQQVLVCLAFLGIAATAKTVVSYLAKKEGIQKAQHLKARYGEESWALITDGDEQTGRELAMDLAKEGLHIMMVSKNEDSSDRFLQSLSHRYPIKTKLLLFDVS